MVDRELAGSEAFKQSGHHERGKPSAVENKRPRPWKAYHDCSGRSAGKCLFTKQPR